MINEIHYSEVFRALPTPCVLLLPDAPVFTVINVSDAYLMLTAVKRDELIGKSFFDVFPRNPYLNDAVWNHIFDEVLFKKKPNKQEPQKYAFPVAGVRPRSDIKYLEVLNTPLLDEQGNVKYILRTMNDVTEAMHHDKFLKDTQQVARMGSWELNMVGRSVIWSEGLREIFEVDPDYPLNFESTFHFYQDEKAREEIQDAVQRVMKDGTVFRVTLPIVTAKGNKRWLLTVGKADLIDGKCVRIFGISQDVTEKRNTEKALISSESNFQNLVQTIDGIVWEANAETFEVTFVSDKVERILGFTVAECLRDPDFWTKHIYGPDRKKIILKRRQQMQSLVNHTCDYRMIRKNGDLIWVQDIASVITKSGKPRWLRGIVVDITEARRLTGIDQLEKTILELNAQQNTPLKQLLSKYLSGIETLFPGLYCSIHRVHGDRLISWSAPSLPKPYLLSIHDRPIGPNAGSCGTAAYLKKPVIVTDIARSRKWEMYKHFALPYGLKASWSYPIIDSKHGVMAVLGMYYKQVKKPNQEELLIIDRTSALLKMILENRLNADIAQEAAAMMAQGQELARFGNWQWDIEANKVSLSPILKDIYGINDTDISFEDCLSLVFKEDKARVRDILQQARQSGKDAVFEERILRPDGEIRHLKSWARLVVNKDEATTKMIVACLDITEAKLAELKLKELHAQLALRLKQVEESEKKKRYYIKAIETQNKKLQEIAWMQSHMVRAPLARIMGLVDLVKNFPESGVKLEELLEAINNSAMELDDILKSITNKAEQINLA